MVISKKLFAISLFTATSLGYLGTFAADNIYAQSGHIKQATALVKNYYQTSNPTINDIWDKVDAVGCAEADAQLEMDSGKCSAFMNPCSLNTCLTMCCVEACVDTDSDPETPCVTQQVTTTEIGFSFPGAWTPSVQ